MKTLGIREHNHIQWKIIFHDDFIPEYRQLSECVQNELNAVVTILRNRGPLVGRPHVDTLKGSRHANMKELRFDTDGDVWRFVFAFDPEPHAIILVGGSKAGMKQDRFYRELLRIADDRFDRHLEWLREQRKKE